MTADRFRVGLASTLFAAAMLSVPSHLGAQGDTLRLRVGSPEIDGRVFPSHSARNRVYMGRDVAPVSTWTNDLAVGDSAGTQVHRWVTRGVQLGPEGAGSSWELVQTYDARTLQPLTYYRWASNGAYTRLRIDGTRVRGESRRFRTRRLPARSTGPSTSPRSSPAHRTWCRWPCACAPVS
jgi:hypothetical protein